MVITNANGLIVAIDVIVTLCKSTFRQSNELIDGLYELLIVSTITLAAIIIQFLSIPKSIVL